MLFSSQNSKTKQMSQIDENGGLSKYIEGVEA